MNTIHKYQLDTIDFQQIDMPKGSEILCIQSQNERPCIWAIVDTNMPLKKRAFEIYGTGHPISDGLNRKYIGTYQLQNGALVFHCFEI